MSAGETQAREIKTDMPMVSEITHNFPIGFRRVKKLAKQHFGFRSTTVINSIVRLLDCGAVGMCDCKRECPMYMNLEPDETFILCVMDKCRGWVGRKKAVKA